MLSSNSAVELTRPMDQILSIVLENFITQTDFKTQYTHHRYTLSGEEREHGRTWSQIHCRRGWFIIVDLCGDGLAGVRGLLSTIVIIYLNFKQLFRQFVSAPPRYKHFFF